MSSENNKKYLIVYHKEDNDGLFSMAIIYNYLVEELHINKDNISLYGADYNDLDNVNYKIDWHDNYDVVYMTDISFDNINDMLNIKEHYSDNFIWIDHHKTIIDSTNKYDFNNTVKGLRNTKHSALYNAFVYLYPEKQIPDLFVLLSAWDSWSYKEENIDFEFCRNVNTGVTIEFNLDSDDIISYVHALLYGYYSTEPEKSLTYIQIQEYETRGKYEWEITDNQNKLIISNYGDFTWTVGDDNRTACALFLQGQTSSLIFKTCKDKVKNGIVFKHLPDGNWGISLYNTDNEDTFHCGDYLKYNYNGGGHQGAAGAQVSEDKFIEILKAKTI